jgi:methyl-accepting chemotaxis protein
MEIDPEAFSQIQNGFGGIRTSIIDTDNALTNSANGFSKYEDSLNHFKLTLVNAFRYNIVNKFVDVISSQIQGVLYYIEDLDSSLNNIRIVTGKTSDEMFEFAESIQKSAEALGRTATEYSDAALIFYQQGLDDSAVTERTESTLKLANVSRQSVEEVSSQLTAI